MNAVPGAMLPISVVILTFNSADTIGATVASARALSDDVHVVDSGSTDATLDIVRAAGASVASHPFESYGAQRNWAIATLALRHPWQLHLDADERRLLASLAEQVVALREQIDLAMKLGYDVVALRLWDVDPSIITALTASITTEGTAVRLLDMLHRDFTATEEMNDPVLGKVYRLQKKPGR
mgnify:CR=1 FL=1